MAEHGPIHHTIATHAGPVDVLLGHALFMALDPKQVAKMRPFPPLATLYAAAALRARGYRVAVFDAMLAPDEGAFEAALDEHPPRLVALYEDNFNFLSKMCLGRMRQAALAMIEQARVRGLPVLAGGSDPTDDPAAYLDAGSAAVILGEGDHTLLEAVGALLGHPPIHNLSEIPGFALSEIPGLALPTPGRGILRTGPRLPERRPDMFPWPARDLVDIEAYRRTWVTAHGHFSVNMASTRGCPFHCNWCAKPIWGQRYAMRSPADVAAEMAEVKQVLAPDRVWFADDIFGLRPDWTAEFGSAVEALGAQIPFQIQSRVDLITDEAADGLARAGCAEVWLGVESGSQRILDAMDKGIRVGEVPAAVARLRGRGIRVCFFLQLGYPGETWEDILATAALVRANLPDDIGISVSYPLPGTRFHDRVAAEIGEKQHWADSHDLAMLFEGRYTSDFYRALHGQLHRELDARQALERAARGEGDGDAAAAGLAGVLDAWAALADLEPASRSAAPTAIPAGCERLPAPDLSLTAN
jgi:anaerobic magnesium-protoporphyrin IX monomethyl ester cyclase